MLGPVGVDLSAVAPGNRDASAPHEFDLAVTMLETLDAQARALSACAIREKSPARDADMVRLKAEYAAAYLRILNLLTHVLGGDDVCRHGIKHGIGHITHRRFCA